MATSLVEVAFFVAIPALFRLSGTFSKKNYKNSCITKIIVVDLY